MSRTLHDVPVRIPDGLYAELWDCRDGLYMRSRCETTAFRSALHRVRCAQCAFAANSARSLPSPSAADRAGLPSLPCRFPSQWSRTCCRWIGRHSGWTKNCSVRRMKFEARPHAARAAGHGAAKRRNAPAMGTKRAGYIHPIRLCFSVLCEQLPQTPLLLALEDLPAQTLTVNGMAISLCKAAGFWVDSCFSLYALPAACWKLGEKSDRVDCSVFRGLRTGSGVFAGRRWRLVPFRNTGNRVSAADAENRKSCLSGASVLQRQGAISV